MELQAITAHLYVVNGEVKNGQNAPGLLTQISKGRTARGRNRDSLFVHLTLNGQLEDTSSLSNDIVDSISNIFYKTPGSVTAALRKAIVDTNKLLLEFNVSGVGRPREGAIVCAALRGEELFTAQVGEALALIGHNFGIERLPAKNPEIVTPLGRSAGLDVRYYHHWLQPGDALLLADPLMAHIPSDDLRPALIDNTIEDAVFQITDLIEQGSSRAILIEFTDDLPMDLPEVIHGGVSTSKRSLPLPIGNPIRTSTSANYTSDEAQVEPDSGTPIDVEYIETTARLATSKAAGGMSRATGGLAGLLSAVRSPSDDEGEDSTWAYPAMLAIIIPLIVGLIVAGIYVQRGQVLYVGDLKTQIEENLELARQAGSDRQASAFYYGEAMRLLAEGQELRPGDDELLQKRLEAQSALDSLSGVSRLGALVFEEFDSDVMLTSIGLGNELNGDLYVLDATNNQILGIPTGEGFTAGIESDPQVIVFGDQAIGSHIVGPLIDLMWRPKGTAVTRDGMAMLDGRGSLITYYPNFGDTRAVNLGLSSEWIQPLNISSFNERLYILDPSANRIWRYFAEGDGFTIGENQKSLEFDEDPDIESVVDFEIISEDGSVVLLYSDGRLRRYARGLILWDETDVAANGLDLPMVSPTALKIAGSGLNSSIFVSDPGLGRILQFSLGGTYLAQFRALDDSGGELFSETTDFVVTDSPLRIFSVARNRVYVATLE